MKTVIILGAGLIGKTIAGDLSDRYKVVVADFNASALENLRQRFPVETVELDFTDTAALLAFIAPADLVIGAVPGMLGFDVLKSVIKAGKNCVDISFFPEDPFKLDVLAKKRNVTVVVDCGVAPGLCNIFAGRHYAISRLKRYECLVGGLPVERTLPFEYKAVFSPIDVIEEYTRPSHIVRNGKAITLDALSEIQHHHFDGIGDLEAFATDGLRTLIRTLHGVPDMQEKTMRYPGHAALMKIFRDGGFFSKHPLRVHGKEVVPLDVTSRILFPQWEMRPGEEDVTIMRVTIDDTEHQHVYSVNDRYDAVTSTTSMARTTGYTCTAAATLVLENKFTETGICPPEFLGRHEECFNAILKYLDERKVNIKKECNPHPEIINA